VSASSFYPFFGSGRCRVIAGAAARDTSTHVAAWAGAGPRAGAGVRGRRRATRDGGRERRDPHAAPGSRAGAGRCVLRCVYRDRAERVRGAAVSPRTNISRSNDAARVAPPRRESSRAWRVGDVRSWRNPGAGCGTAGVKNGRGSTSSTTVSTIT
jgi:hypothetical protein